MTPYAPTQRARSPRAARIVSVAVAAAAVLAASVVPAGAATYSITPGGASVVVTVSTAGGSSRANFSGTAGQRVAVRATNTSILAGQIRLQDSSGTILRTSGLNTGGAWLDMVTVPPRHVLDRRRCQRHPPGSTTVTLYNEPAGPRPPPSPPARRGCSRPRRPARTPRTRSTHARLEPEPGDSTVSTPILNVIVKNPDGTTRRAGPWGVGSK